MALRFEKLLSSIYYGGNNNAAAGSSFPFILYNYILNKNKISNLLSKPIIFNLTNHLYHTTTQQRKSSSSSSSSTISSKLSTIIDSCVNNTSISRKMINDLYSYFSNLPRWHIFAIFATGYVVYYLIEVVKTPILAASNGPFKTFLLNNVPTLEMKFWPTFWCVESRAQTVFASILRSQIIPKINYRREMLTLKDGGEVALDWLEDDCKPDSPLILILPGLTGESQAEYIKCLVMAAKNIGIRVVVFNNRGLGGVILKTPRLYCAANSEDLSEVIHHVREINPLVKFGATGISMGGLILGNYLARHSEEANSMFTACEIISVPWDVHKGTASIEKPYLNSLLGKHLTNNLCRTISKCDVFKNSEFDMVKILQSKTIKEFDSHFTSKHFGFDDVEQYYTAATLHDKLHKITVPLLCLSAADDPFQPLEAIPIIDAEKSSHVAIVVTARGGHIGFLEGWWPYSKDQYMGRLFSQFFNATLYDESGDFERTSHEMMTIYDKQNLLSKISSPSNEQITPSISSTSNKDINNE